MSFHKSALFTDMTENYLEPSQPQPHTRMKVRFRTGRNNVNRIIICYNRQKAFMRKEASDDLFDYYFYNIRVEEEELRYYFEIQSGNESCYYNRMGVSKSNDPNYDFVVIPGFTTPEWAKGAVMYQIYVDRFYNGDKTNDVKTGEYFYIGERVEHVEDWNEPPKENDTGRFYGGDLQGVIDKLDYLSELGIDAIYLNPVFVSPSNHKYDTQDYDHIDPHFGKIVNDSCESMPDDAVSNEAAVQYIKRTTDKENLEASDRLFARLVEEAHRRNIRVVIDGVFNHCGSFHKFMDKEGIYANAGVSYDKGAYRNKDSHFTKFFSFKDEAGWPDNDSYQKWWGYDTLPKLNYENSRNLYEYILSVGSKWVAKPYCADGWRLDVAADLGHNKQTNHKFWQDFRATVKEANPDALILAEYYGPAREWLKGREWDSVMNYDAFMEPITWFLTGMEKHSNEYRQELQGNANIFWTSMLTAGLNFTNASAMVAMNELSNHDHSRFLTRTNHVVGDLKEKESKEAELGISKAVMREAVVMQMTWPGAPTIYYGDEAGVCGFTDPDNRRTYPWGREDMEMLSFHKEMIRIHKENPELIKGSLIKLYAQPYVTAYARFTHEQQTIVIVNCSDVIKDISMSVWEAGVPAETLLDRIMVTTNEGFNAEGVEIPVTKGRIEISLLPQSAIVLKHKNKGLMRRRQKLIKHF